MTRELFPLLPVLSHVTCVDSVPTYSLYIMLYVTRGWCPLDQLPAYTVFTPLHVHVYMVCMVYGLTPSDWLSRLVSINAVVRVCVQPLRNYVLPSTTLLLVVGGWWLVVGGGVLSCRPVGVLLCSDVDRYDISEIATISSSPSTLYPLSPSCRKSLRFYIISYSVCTSVCVYERDPLPPPSPPSPRPVEIHYGNIRPSTLVFTSLAVKNLPIFFVQFFPSPARQPGYWRNIVYCIMCYPWLWVMVDEPGHQYVSVPV